MVGEAVVYTAKGVTVANGETRSPGERISQLAPLVQTLVRNSGRRRIGERSIELGIELGPQLRSTCASRSAAKRVEMESAFDVTASCGSEVRKVRAVPLPRET